MPAIQKSLVARNAFLELLLNNVPFTGVGDAAGLGGSATNGVLWLSLHRLSIGPADHQAQNESLYTGYARQSIARDPVSPKWTVVNGVATNAVQIDFGLCTVGTENVFFVGLGTDSTGTGALKLHGTLFQTLPIYPGMRPRFEVGTLILQEF